MVFHILNGDSLKNQFPADSIPGEIIVARECMVDGETQGITLDEIIDTRVRFMNKLGVSEHEYFQKTVPELQKITEINKGEANLWFEDDLFCQVNFWFVCSLLSGKSIKIYLVRPSSSIQYGFGGHKPEELRGLYEKRTLLTNHQVFELASLWKAYQNEDFTSLKSISGNLSNDFPFLQKAVQAQLKRFPYGNGLPEQTLKNIMQDLHTQDFGPIFQEFSKRVPIYGFGDLQVKRLYDQLIEK